MQYPEHVNQIIKVVGLCVLWYIVSSSNNVVGKTLLSDFPFPVTVTVAQLSCITLLSGPLLDWWTVRKYSDVPRPYYMRVIVPLALGKFLSSVASHVSIWKVPISYAHTVKATMPLFVVVLSRVILGDKQPTKVYISLIPIILGVMIATATEISFDMIGLISALLATFGFSLQNIFSKKVLHDTSMHHLRLLQTLARLALSMALPLWLLTDFWTIVTSDTVLTSNNLAQNATLLALDAFLNFLQNVIAFSVLSLVNPLTYSIANSSKRICIVTVSLILMKNPVTATNVMGMFMAITGVLYYNKVKYDALRAKSRQSLLPTSLDKTSTSNRLYDDYNHFVLPANTPYILQQPYLNGSAVNGHAAGLHSDSYGNQANGTINNNRFYKPNTYVVR